MNPITLESLKATGAAGLWVKQHPAFNDSRPVRIAFNFALFSQWGLHAALGWLPGRKRAKHLPLMSREAMGLWLSELERVEH